jgi:hypothetical protein
MAQANRRVEERNEFFRIFDGRALDFLTKNERGLGRPAASNIL